MAAGAFDWTNDPSWVASRGYVQSCPDNAVSEDDPTVVLAWQHHSVDQFVANVAGSVLPRPLFLALGPVTAESFQDQVVQHLSHVGGGGRFHDAVIGPNTLQQYGNVRDRLTSVEMHPWVQAGMMGVAAGAPLAFTAFLTDREVAVPHAMARVPPGGALRQVFA